MNKVDPQNASQTLIHISENATPYSIWQNSLSEKTRLFILNNKNFFNSEENYLNNPNIFLSLIKIHKCLDQSVIKTQSIINTIDSLQQILTNTLLNYQKIPNCEESINLFKLLISKKFPNVEETFANWIQFYKIDLRKLNLTFDEIIKIAPFFTKIEFNDDKFTTEQVAEIFTKFERLKELKLETPSLKSISIFPKKLEKLNVSFCHKLSEINSLSEDLKEFCCLSNETLKRLPKSLPRNLIYLNVCDNPNLKELPELSPSLQHLSCTESEFGTLPKLPDTIEFLDISNNPNIEKIKSLPSSLKKLIIYNCENLKEIPPLPKSLETRHIDWTDIKLPSDFEPNEKSKIVK